MHIRLYSSCMIYCQNKATPLLQFGVLNAIMRFKSFTQHAKLDYCTSKYVILHSHANCSCFIVLIFGTGGMILPKICLHTMC